MSKEEGGVLPKNSSQNDGSIEGSISGDSYDDKESYYSAYDDSIAYSSESESEEEFITEDSARHHIGRSAKLSESATAPPSDKNLIY